MADLLQTTQANLLQPDYPELQQLNRQQAFAQNLMNTGLQGQPQGQMVSGWYVKPSITQALNPLVQALTGAYLGNKAEQKGQELAAALRGKQQEAVQNYMTAMNPTQTELAGPSQNGTPVQTVNTPDYNAAFAAATSPYAPAPLQAAGYEMLKPLTTKEGETVSRFNFNNGGYTPIAQGGVNLPAEVKAATAVLGLPNDPTKWSQQDRVAINNQILSMKRAGSTTVNLPPVESAYNKTFGEGIANQDLALKANADSAQSTVANIGRQKQILDSGKFFAGPTANAQQAVANYGTALGVTGKDAQEKAANTQSLISGSAGVTLDNIKGSGLGAGQGFTDKDLQFLQDAKSYRITMNETNIRRILDLQEKAAIESVKKWNTRQGQIQKSATGPINVGPVAIPQSSNVVDYNSLK